MVQQGICSPQDIREAKAEATRLLTPEYSRRIRDAEKLLGALGDSNRIRIIYLLSRREMCVCEIEAALGLSQPTASHHLGLLEQVGLLERNRRARRVFYKINVSPIIDEVLRMIKGGENHGER